MPKNKQLIVQCSQCRTRFVREKVGKEQCGVCGDGKERMMKAVKRNIKPKNHAKASGRPA